jgi:SNF2 family DNA or RNA helicase
MYRVLFLSSVGSVGLNLTRANYLIYQVGSFTHKCPLINTSLQDQHWSAQDERQTRGRIHRPPQQKVVTCYHLLANNTADIILSGFARGKRDMMEAFLSKPAGKGMTSGHFPSRYI